MTVLAIIYEFISTNYVLVNTVEVAKTVFKLQALLDRVVSYV
jgi:hypothetical protein